MLTQGTTVRRGAGVTYRIAVDVGGTFVDVVVSDEGGRQHIGKVSCTEDRAFASVTHALTPIADTLGLDVAELLRRTSSLVYTTSHATNAMIEGGAARTAFLTTRGFADTLLLREVGIGREGAPPYVPRHLTFEIDERTDSDGSVFNPLVEDGVLEIATRCRSLEVEAIGVSLLWSISNPEHELRVGELLGRELPEVPVTLSHELDPVPPECIRAHRTVVDASLKPLIRRVLDTLASDLAAAGFTGRLLGGTDLGGTWPVELLTQQPIHSVRSGPSMAATAALHACRYGPELLVCDIGGTTFDVSLVSGGAPATTETGAVDTRSIGVGGGSIASVDDAGLMSVGPGSAGSSPGPACYGTGGTLPTLTDAALVLGYLDPKGFLDGRMPLDEEAASAAWEPVAADLGLTVEDTARGAMVIAAQRAVTEVRALAAAHGVDPRTATLVAGGGAAGLIIATLARELGCARMVVPHVSPVLAAAGGLHADVIRDFHTTHYTESGSFATEHVNEVLTDIEDQADRFLEKVTALGPVTTRKEFSVHARYPGELTVLRTRLPITRFRGLAGLAVLLDSFHRDHQRVYSTREPGQRVECLVWQVRAVASTEKIPDTPSAQWALAPGTEVTGPAVVRQPFSTLVLHHGDRLTVADNGDHLISPGPVPVS